MTTRLCIYISILSIFSSSQSMEIIKKKIKQKHITENKHTNIITKEFFTTQRILDNNKTFPKEVITNIRRYCILLKEHDFEKNEQFAKHWNDFSIPVKYYTLLTPKQKKVIEYILVSTPYIGHGPNGPQIDYKLKSMKQYSQFVALPIELREYLTLLPKSALETQIIPYSPNTPINPGKTIQVKTVTADLLHNDGDFYGSISKPIIPENNKKKSHKK